MWLRALGSCLPDEAVDGGGDGTQWSATEGPGPFPRRKLAQCWLEGRLVPRFEMYWT